MKLPDLKFSYSQFFIYDARLVSPTCEWTERHFSQGFARRDGAICVVTLLEFGAADVAVTFNAPPNLQRYDRAIAVPLTIRGQELAICGPDEGAATRRVAVRKGHYRVTVAQKVIDEMREEIGIWFQWLDIPLERSELLIVDDGLDAAQPLLETAKSLSGD